MNNGLLFPQPLLKNVGSSPTLIIHPNGIFLIFAHLRYIIRLKYLPFTTATSNTRLPRPHSSSLSSLPLTLHSIPFLSISACSFLFTPPSLSASFSHLFQPCSPTQPTFSSPFLPSTFFTHPLPLTSIPIHSFSAT